VQDILTHCPDCYGQAALAEYRTGNFDKAIEFCDRVTPDEGFVCYSQLFSLALEKNQLQQAETLCRQYLEPDLGNCLQPLARGWVAKDERYALDLCTELDPSDARHFGCILDLALAIRSRDLEGARRICRALPEHEIELCLQEVEK
jgi:hypothetical protein